MVLVTRHNILNNINARDKYVQGVKLLKNDFLSPEWPNTYDIFIIWHYYAMMNSTPPRPLGTRGRNSAHSGPAFLPWHRWMLILFENHLQRVLNDPNFGLPYWDWGSDGQLPSSQQQTAPIWTNSYMGGSGFPVTTGPFMDGSWQINVEAVTMPGSTLPVLVPTNRGLRRSLASSQLAPALPTKADVYTAVHRNETGVFYDKQQWDTNSEGFRNELEGWFNGPGLHNRVHVWIGGDMGPASSPNDPVFYLNHCNVDRIWAGWQEIYGNPPYVPSMQAENTLRGHRLNDYLFEITTSNFFDPIYLGRVRPADLLDISARYNYSTYDDLR